MEQHKWALWVGFLLLLGVLRLVDAARKRRQSAQGDFARIDAAAAKILKRAGRPAPADGQRTMADVAAEIAGRSGNGRSGNGRKTGKMPKPGRAQQATASRQSMASMAAASTAARAARQAARSTAAKDSIAAVLAARTPAVVRRNTVLFGQEPVIQRRR